MHFSGIFPCFMAVLAVASPITDAKPVVYGLVERQSTDIMTILSSLETSVSSIIPDIMNMAQMDNSTAEMVMPYLDQLNSAFSNTATSVGALPPNAGEGQSSEDASAMLAKIVSMTADALCTLHSHHEHDWFPSIEYLLIDIDFQLHKLLIAVAILLDDVLILVAKLLYDVGNLLIGLGFALTVALLQL